MITANKNTSDEYYSMTTEKMEKLPNKHFSITLNDFKDERECDIILLKINEMLTNWKSRTKVF